MAMIPGAEVGPSHQPANRRDRRPGVALTGWLCAGAGAALLLSGAAFGMAGVLARAVAQQGTDIFAEVRQGMDPLSAALLDHVGAVAAVLALTGLSSLIIGIQFARLRPAARPAMELLSWVILAGTVVLQAAALLLLRHSDASVPTSWASHPAVSTALSLLQVGVCVGIIRFVRSAGVREAFRTGAAGKG